MALAGRQPTLIPDLEKHTHHAPDSQGSRCISCHMSDVNWRLLNRRLDHTFQPPVPEMTAKYGVPSACTTCHEDKISRMGGRDDEHVVRERGEAQSGRDDGRHDLSSWFRRHVGAAGRRRPGGQPLTRRARYARAPRNSRGN